MNINATALLRSTVAVMWLIVGMTLVTEVSPAFKAFLVQLAGHHWIGKSLIAVAALVVFYVLFRKSRESKGVLGGVLLVIGSVVLGGLSIFSFFLWNFFNS